MQVAANQTASARAPTILVVDDELQIRDLLARWLTASGYRCLLAENVANALRCLRSEPIGLITADISMPEISGIDLVRRVRQSHPETAVLMLTGLQMTSTAIEALTAGAIAYLI